MIQFDEYVSDGLKPPTSCALAFYKCDYHGFGILPDIFCSNIVGFSSHEEMIQLDEHICSKGLKPPTSYDWRRRIHFETQ